MFRLPKAAFIHSKTLKTLSNRLRSGKNKIVCRQNYATKPPPQMSSNEDVAHNKYEPLLQRHDREVNLFEPRDSRMPLPGNIGIATNANDNNSTSLIMVRDENQFTSSGEVVDMIANDSNYMRQYRVVDQLLSPENDHKLSSLPSSRLECVAHECPKLLIQDFKDLFPLASQAEPQLTKNLTVVTLCQKTDNDMSEWTQEVDEEREQLMEHFVVVAQDVCNYLNECGFWADFIDPSSGRPFLGEFTNASMFETDERYRHFGFQIEDLGCCKVISHHIWGTHAFVGALFTNAPIDSTELQKVLMNSYRDNDKK